MKKLLAFVLALTLGLSLVACGNPFEDDGEGGNEQKQEDKTKSQLNISCWDGGFGVEWLESIGHRFEETYKDHSFEPGKVGVQVWVTPTKGNVYDSFASSIVAADNDIAISEQCNYNGFVVKKTAVDITDAVTTPLTEYGETRSIADKLSTADREFYGVASDTYYGLPWYESTSGFQYDKDLFEEELFYFAADGEGDSDGFIKRSDTKRSNGPDGIYGTDDDGLPATYDDFFKLCDRVAEQDMVPVIWAGAVQVYINNLLLALIADYEGYDQMSLAFNLDGTATNLIDSIDADGTVHFKAPTEINNANGYLMRSSAGYYYGLKFLERLLTTKKADGHTYKYFDESKSLSDTRSQKQSQSDFLRGRYSSNLQTTAMTIEGTWWYSEANATFKQMASIPGASAIERNIGFMPMPKVDKDHLGPATYINNWMTSVNVSAAIDSAKIPMAKQFIRFMHTDKSLSEFTRITSGVRPFSYELTAEDEPLTSPYAKDVLKIHNNNTPENPTIVNPWSRNNLVLNNLADFMINDQIFNCKIGNDSYNMVSNAIIKYGISAKDYYYGITNYYSQAMWNNAYSRFF